MTRSLISKFREFLNSVKQSGRVVTSLGASLGYGPAVYDLSLWSEFAGMDAFAASLVGGVGVLPVTFVWRPRTFGQFWSALSAYQLQVVDGYGPTVMGIHVRLGEGLRPRGVVYDLEAVCHQCRADFRDSYDLRQKRRPREERYREIFAAEVRHQFWDPMMAQPRGESLLVDFSAQA